MKKIVLLGAYDRYNYGDNLMPIVFEMYFKKYHKDILKKYEFIFSAIKDSDLSRYGGKKTTAISSVIRDENIDSIVVVGGEVLCASSSTLYLHMPDSENLTKLVKLLRRFRLEFVANLLCKHHLLLPWEYPYIPKPKKTKVLFNTVGGGVSKRSIAQKLFKVRNRLKNANYLSVRDIRTLRSLEGFSEARLYPDSVLIVSDLIDDHFLNEKISSELPKCLSENYLCFQAAPLKAGGSAQEAAIILEKIAEKNSLKIVLLPIGYADGHDDYLFLKEVQKYNDSFDLIYDLNIWEIMYTIKNSELFIGTSLHGVITSIAFDIPHIGLNPKVRKLDYFLKSWSIPNINRSYYLHELENIVPEALDSDRNKLKTNREKLQSKIKENFSNISKLWC